ncbi:unnamed protein product [Miscanthus lutarioriparius]|uniref:Uncharacterized protein n=1 Tax=Miscanthus lutarioriparius TaxID=422564 RepID=A0A811MVH5_9POAL|nr:unnamed protein product [Miscanthus lutarioriparius]
MGPSPLSLNGQYPLLSPLTTARPTNTTPAEQPHHTCLQQSLCCATTAAQTSTSSRDQSKKPDTLVKSVRYSRLFATSATASHHDRASSQGASATATSHLSPGGEDVGGGVPWPSCSGLRGALLAAPCRAVQAAEVVVDDRPAQVDIWNVIQADVDKVAPAGAKKASKPYVHPLVRRSSSLMSQKSLEVCTESLGNETSSGDFTSSLDMASLFDSPLPQHRRSPSGSTTRLAAARRSSGKARISRR